MKESEEFKDVRTDVLIREKLDRIEKHVDLAKKREEDRDTLLEDIALSLRDVVHTLKGNKYNNNKGLVDEFEDIKGAVKTLRTEMDKKNVYLEIYKYVVGILIGVIITHVITNGALAPTRDDKAYKPKKESTV